MAIHLQLQLITCLRCKMLLQNLKGCIIEFWLKKKYFLLIVSEIWFLGRIKSEGGEPCGIGIVHTEN